jgi:hypothetical protein
MTGWKKQNCAAFLSGLPVSIPKAFGPLRLVNNFHPTLTFPDACCDKKR